MGGVAAAGDDLIALSRTAWPDGLGGPVRQHDANYLTFHRFKNFRVAFKEVMEGTGGKATKPGAD